MRTTIINALECLSLGPLVTTMIYCPDNQVMSLFLETKEDEEFCPVFDYGEKATLRDTWILETSYFIIAHSKPIELI